MARQLGRLAVERFLSLFRGELVLPSDEVRETLSSRTQTTSKNNQTMQEVRDKDL